jgi:hypothetical protein
VKKQQTDDGLTDQLIGFLLLCVMQILSAFMKADLSCLSGFPSSE